MNETASKPIIHEVRGANFHGSYCIRLRGPAEGFELSEAQARKLSEVLCGLSGCTCSTAQLEPEWGAARVVLADYTADGEQVLRLLPAGATRDECRNYMGGHIA